MIVVDERKIFGDFLKNILFFRNNRREEYKQEGLNKLLPSTMLYEIRTKNSILEFSDGELVLGMLVAVVSLILMNALFRIKKRYRIDLSKIESSIVAIFMVHMGLWMIGGKWIFKRINLDKMYEFAMPLIAIILVGLTLFLRRLRTRPQHLRLHLNDDDLLITLSFSIFDLPDLEIEIEEDELLYIVEVSFNMINVFQLLAWIASYVYKDGVLLGILAVTAVPTIYIAIPFMMLLLYTMILTILGQVDMVMMDDETDDESLGSEGSDVSEVSEDYAQVRAREQEGWQANWSNWSDDNWSDVSDED